MFLIIFQSIVIIYIILSVYYLLELQKYNFNGILNKATNVSEINEILKNLNPILFNKKINIQIEEPINIGFDEEYIPISNYNSSKDNQIYIHKNKRLFQDMKLDNHIINLQFLNDYDKIPFTYNSVSVYKNVSSKLYRCCHNYNLIGVINGETTVYLFNPKHKKDIINKSNNKIKKWAHKHILSKDDILVIPPNWYYIQETPDKVIQYNIDADTYFTFIPNFFK
jgi:hypothetical protein